MSVQLPGDSDLDPPEWIECDDCGKWRKLPTEYILAVRDGPWNCSAPGSDCTCAEACHSCSGDTCICAKSGFWEDPTDPEKCTFAFGANIPKGFTHFVKQKPAGQLYVEYDVDCFRCNVHATLDRRFEPQRTKERLHCGGKGDARTLECWLRDHQACNADWNRLNPNSLDFTVPLGPRRFRNTKSPLYTPLPPATSASSESAASDLSTAVTSAQSSACRTHPNHTSASDSSPTNGPQHAPGAPPQHTALEQGPVPASLVLKEETDSEELPAPAHPVGNAPSAPVRLDNAVADSSSASAAQGPPANLHTATPNATEAKPSVQGQASRCGTAKRAKPGGLLTPKGLNGLLLSRSQKRKANSVQVPSSEPQAVIVDLTMSDDDSADTKRVKAEPPEGADDYTDHADSLALMVQEVNRSLAGNPITMEQLQRLQDAVDGVSELKDLQAQELTHVLAAVGSLETVQKIFVRRYLRNV